MPVWNDQGALPGVGEERQSPVCGAGAGQSGDGEAAVITDLSGQVRPKFVDRVEQGKLKWRKRQYRGPQLPASTINFGVRLENDICSELP